METNNTLEHNKTMLSERLEIHPDSLETFAISVTELTEAGVGLIRSLEFCDDNAYNWAMLLTDENENVFYLELSEYGNIVLLKKDGNEGEALISFECAIEVMEAGTPTWI